MPPNVWGVHKLASLGLLKSSFFSLSGQHKFTLNSWPVPYNQGCYSGHSHSLVPLLRPDFRRYSHNLFYFEYQTLEGATVVRATQKCKCKISKIQKIFICLINSLLNFKHFWFFYTIWKNYDFSDAPSCIQYYSGAT